jgi:hypothetical protein
MLVSLHWMIALVILAPLIFGTFELATACLVACSLADARSSLGSSPSGQRMLPVQGLKPCIGSVRPPRQS